MILFVHAAPASRKAAEAAFARSGRDLAVRHIVAAGLVDAAATDFPITEERYAAMRSVLETNLSPEVKRVVLSCSVYNATAERLSADLRLPVERSDAAGTEVAVAHARAKLGVVISYAPSRETVLGYVRRIAGARGRRIAVEAAEAPGAFAGADDLVAYGAAIDGAAAQLRGADTIFLSQYSMDPIVDVVRASNPQARVVSAAAETVAAL